MKLNPPISIKDAKKILSAPDQELKALMEHARKVAEDIHGPNITFYVPGNSFPAISITGTKCWLLCKHCVGHYLKGMIPATTPDEFRELCVRLWKRGAKGCLISGGYTRFGALPIESFFEAIKYVKKNTKLLLNVHPGFLSRNSIMRLVQCGIDAASIDVVGSEETTKQVYGISKDPQSYDKLLCEFKTAGVPILAPHVCIGLHFGKLLGELHALSIIRNHEPSVLVFIIFTPTRGTPMEACSPPNIKDVIRLIVAARLMMPGVPISLGCMRPKGTYRRVLDEVCMRAGVNRIVIPSGVALDVARDLGYEVLSKDLCCVFA
ncbi:MAG: hypothetical protein ACTSXJ_02870 [Candidatus Baldrarchaeia archaeon]